MTERLVDLLTTRAEDEMTDSTVNWLGKARGEDERSDARNAKRREAVLSASGVNEWVSQVCRKRRKLGWQEMNVQLWSSQIGKIRVTAHPVLSHGHSAVVFWSWHG
jgi:hypothetical protein